MVLKIVLGLTALYFIFKKSDTDVQAEKDFQNFFDVGNFFGGLMTDISGINDKYDHLFVKYGQRYGVDPKTLKAIGLNESYLGKYTNTVTVNGNTTGGIMHIELPTARDYEPQITQKELWQPENEIRIAAMHIKKLMDRYDGNIELVARAYNGGMGRVQEYLNGTVNSTWKKNTTAYYDRFKRHYNKLG